MALASISFLMVERAPKFGCHRCLCPQGEFQLPPASLEGSPISAGGSDPGTFQITASALGPRACEFLCVPFKSGTSISYSLLALKLSPTDLQSQTFWGSFSQCRTLRLGNLLGAQTPCSLERTSVIVIILVDRPPRVFILTVPHLHHSYQSCGSFFISSLVEGLFC